MNGLKYIINAKELSLKEVSERVQVTSQLVALWASGSRNIPQNHAQTLSDYFGVDVSLLTKQKLLLDDKIQIELQLDSGCEVSESLKGEINLQRKYERLKEINNELKERLQEAQAENQELREKIDTIKAVFANPL